MDAIKLQFAFERETKGAVRYQELDVNGSVAANYAIGTLYLRKSAIVTSGSTWPQKIEVEVKW